HDIYYHSHLLYNNTSPPEISPLSLHDALPISRTAPSSSFMARVFIRSDSVCCKRWRRRPDTAANWARWRNSRAGYMVWATLPSRSEEHTSELQSRGHLVCRLLLEKQKKTGWNV